MKCPICQAWTIIKQSRESPDFGYIRRRECANLHRFTTAEVIIPDEILTDKKRERLKKHSKIRAAKRQEKKGKK